MAVFLVWFFRQNEQMLGTPNHRLSYPELLPYPRSSPTLLLYLTKRAVRRRRRERVQMTRATKGRSCMLKGRPEPKCLEGEVREHSFDQSSGTRLPVSCLNFSRGQRVAQPGKVRG